MKIRDIVTESARSFSDRTSSTMPTTYAFPNMPSSDTYKAYRFGVAMANHEQTNNKQGPTDEYAVVVAYSSGEEAIIQAAKKRTGQHSVKVADPGSHEPAGTAVASPVARVKRNRWGV